jgi:hypothetical protein
MECGHDDTQNRMMETDSTADTKHTPYSGCIADWTSGLQPGAREIILRNRLNLEPALILTFTKIRPRAEVLACQKQAQSSQ